LFDKKLLTTYPDIAKRPEDHGQPLTDSEQREAEGLVDLADLLSLLHMRQQNYPVVICKMPIFQTARTGAG
jgi:hypothetical protein